MEEQRSESSLKFIRFQKSAQVFMWCGFGFMCLLLVWVVKENLIQPDLANAVLHPRSMRQIPDFHFIDFDNGEFGKQQMLGKWSFLFVGYTLCPDICPVTLHQMKNVHSIMKDNKMDDNVQFLFLSVDPERDNLLQLKTYVQYFDESFIGITGTLPELEAFCDAIGADFYKVKHPDEPRFYYVVHSAEIFLFNPEGELYALSPPPHKADVIAGDFSVIKQHNESYLLPISTAENP